MRERRRVTKEKANNLHQRHLWNINSDKDLKKNIYNRFKNKWKNEWLIMNTKLNEIKGKTKKLNNPISLKRRDEVVHLHQIASE